MSFPIKLAFILSATVLLLTSGVNLANICEPDYLDWTVVEPFLTSKCVICHDDDWAAGGVNMAHPETYTAGDEPLVRLYDADSSPLYTVCVDVPEVSLRGADHTLMLTAEELTLLREWIDTGGYFIGY
ncbi:hypothetical protein K8R78_07060 [bacterium]|nr:hypothetical protein [bacterium]